MVKKHLYRINLLFWAFWDYVKVMLLRVRLPWKHYVVTWDDGQMTFWTDGAKAKHPELGHLFLLSHLVKYDTPNTPECTVEDWGFV